MRNKNITFSELKDLLSGLKPSGNQTTFDRPIAPQTTPLTVQSLLPGPSEFVSGKTFTTDSPEAYLLRLQSEVTSKYQRLLMDPKNRSLLGRNRFAGLDRMQTIETITSLTAAENLDLSLLTREASNEIYAAHRASALLINDLFQRVGAPAMSLPSDSPYRHFLRYIIDPFSGYSPEEGIHPLILNLMRTNFNPTSDAVSIEDFSTGKNRMRTEFSLQRLMERSRKFFPQGLGRNQPMNHLSFDKGTGSYDVLTWDTETTGLTPDAQIRDIALVRRTVTVNAAGEYESSVPTIISRKSFASDLMDIASAVDSRGNTIPLSEAVFLSELGAKTAEDVDPVMLSKFRNAFKNGGASAVQDFKELITQMLNADRLEGHNAAAFDLDKFVSTIERLPAFQQDEEAKSLMRQFRNKRLNSPDYFIDTLDSATILMAKQQSELLGILSEPGLELSDQLRMEIVRSMSISDEIFGRFKRNVIFREFVFKY